jgi:Segregation and condensation complex subunit ScpB
LQKPIPPKAIRAGVSPAQPEPVLETGQPGPRRIAGRHDSLGRPVLYGTTRKFLQVFGLKNLEECRRPNSSPAEEWIPRRAGDKTAVGAGCKREDFWQQMVACPLTTQQRSGPTSAVTRFIRTLPFPLAYKTCAAHADVEGFAKATLTKFGARPWKALSPAPTRPRGTRQVHKGPERSQAAGGAKAVPIFYG